MNCYNYAPETMNPATEMQAPKNLPKLRNRNKPNARALPEKAVEIMTAWYDQHYIDPYPSYRDYEQMAKHGNITIAQVKQWFINVRRRTHNQFRKKRAPNTISDQSHDAINTLINESILNVSAASNSSNESYYSRSSFGSSTSGNIYSANNSPVSNQTMQPMISQTNSPSYVYSWSSPNTYPSYYNFSHMQQYYDYSYYSPAVYDEIKKFSF